MHFCRKKRIYKIPGKNKISIPVLKKINYNAWLNPTRIGMDYNKSKGRAATGKPRITMLKSSIMKVMGDKS